MIIEYLEGRNIWLASICHFSHPKHDFIILLHSSHHEFLNGSAIKECIVGTPGCVPIGIETHESGIAKWTAGEALGAFSWDQLGSGSVSIDTQQIIPAFVSYTNLKVHNKYIYGKKCALFSFHGSEVIMPFASCWSLKLGAINRYYWNLFVMKWSLWMKQVVFMVAQLWCHA